MAARTTISVIYAENGDTQAVITMLIDRKTFRKFAIIHRKLFEPSFKRLLAYLAHNVETNLDFPLVYMYTLIYLLSLISLFNSKPGRGH